MASTIVIPQATISAFAIAAVCTTVLPIVLLIVLGVKKKINVVPLFVGMASFLVSQIFLRIPIISLLSTQGWYQAFAANQYVLYILVLSLSAGLFEESARLVGAHLLKKKRSFQDVLSFGLGHGLCEVMVLVGMTYISNLFVSLQWNSGAAAIHALPAEALQQMLAQLMAVRPVDIGWGIVERISAVLFHIFATTLVFRGVVEKKIGFYFLAILAHTAFNVCASMLLSVAGIAVTEIVLLALGLLGGYFVIKQKGRFPTPEVAAPEEAPPAV